MAGLLNLVPKYLPAVRQDPFAPAPLVYRRTDKGALLYSVGPDGMDDGGTDTAHVTSASKGDLVVPHVD